MIGYIRRRQRSAHVKASKIVHAALGSAALEGVGVDAKTRRQLERAIRRRIFWPSLLWKLRA